MYNNDYDCENGEVCEHLNVVQEEFIKIMTHSVGGTVIISVPHTARFKCLSCSIPIDIFVVGGVFNI